MNTLLQITLQTAHTIIHGLTHQAASPLLAFSGSDAAMNQVSVFHSLPMLTNTLLFFAGIAILFGIILAVIAQKFKTERDPRTDKVLDALAKAHCGACGFAGCESYAEAVISNPDVPPDLCTPGGAFCAKTVSDLTGKSMSGRTPTHAFIMCQGTTTKAGRSYVYTGLDDCRAIALTGGGDVTCEFGCLGRGSCVRVCPFDAIAMGDDGLPKVNSEKCTACGKCVATCPRNVIELLKKNTQVYVACHSHDPANMTRKNCSIGCIGCGLCRKVCPVKAPVIDKNLSVIAYKTCTACGVCVGKCPTKSIIRV